MVHGSWTERLRDVRHWQLVAREMAGTGLIMIVYFLLRGQRPDDIQGAVEASVSLIDFERSLGLLQEAAWQRAFIDHDWLMAIANVVYAWLHYPVMLTIGLWLIVKDPIRFRFIRNVLLVSAIIGLVVYWLVPAAPPRLMGAHGYDLGIRDTVHGAASNVHYFQPGPFVNQYAALPSFHFGWIALCSAAIWVNTRMLALRMVAVAMSAIMWWAIVVTGNHYFVDMVFGGLVVAFAWTAVALCSRYEVGPRTWAASLRFHRRMAERLG